VSDESGVIATAAIGSGDLILLDGYGRNVGVIVPSSSFFELTGNLAFESHALPFAPASVMPQSQTCVRGFRLPDGTLITGDVEFVGIDGLVIIAEPELNAITFNAVGKPDPPSCVELCGPVKSVTVQQIGLGGVWAINFTEEGVLSLDAAYGLEDVCEERRSLVLPTDGKLPNVTKDQCEEGEGEDDPEIDPPAPVDPVTAYVNRISVLPVSDLVGLEVVEEPGMPAYPAHAGLPALPERPRQGLKIYMRGL